VNYNYASAIQAQQEKQERQETGHRRSEERESQQECGKIS
jgi:hypothetical protein